MWESIALFKKMNPDLHVSIIKNHLIVDEFAEKSDLMYKYNGFKVFFL